MSTLRIIKKFVNSDDCTVLVQLTRAQYERLRAAWKVHSESAVRWLHSEIYAQGGGWYAIMSRDGYINGALRGLSNLHFALFGYQPVVVHSRRDEQVRRNLSRVPVWYLHRPASVLRPEDSWREAIPAQRIDPMLAAKKLAEKFNVRL